MLSENAITDRIKQIEIGLSGECRVLVQNKDGELFAPVDHDADARFACSQTWRDKDGNLWGIFGGKKELVFTKSELLGAI